MSFENTGKSSKRQEPNTSADSPEAELSAETVEALMEAAIIHGQKHNEGQNAVIFRVQVSKLPEEALHQIFTAQGKEVPTGKLASKVIKVYVSAAALNEANNHQEIFDLVQGQDDQEGMAIVPEPHVNAELAIRTDTMKERLVEAGISVQRDKVGVMMMDFVKGIDLMTHIYRGIIKNLPEEDFNMIYPDANIIKKELEENPDAVDFARLEEAIVFALAIQGSDAGESTEDRIRRDLGNRSRVFDSFQKLGLTINPEILARVRKTVSLLNSNNIYHNDLHERNIMIETDDEGELVDVFLIDFDKVSGTKDESWGGDMGVVSEYGKLTKTKEELVQEKKDKEIQDAIDFVEKVKKHRKKEWEEFEESIRDLIGKKYPKILEYLDKDIQHFANTHGNISPEQLAAGIILELSKTEPKLARDFIEYKRSNPGGGGRPFINLLIKLLPHIEVEDEAEE